MKQLFLLLLVGLVGVGIYTYFTDPSFLEKHVPAVAKLIPTAPKEAVVAGLVAAEVADTPPAPALSPQPAAPASVAPSSSRPTVSSAPGAPKSPSAPATTTVGSSAAQPAADLDTIRMKDGKVYTGKIVITDADITWIRTADGKTQEVRTRDIRSGLPPAR